MLTQKSINYKKNSCIFSYMSGREILNSILQEQLECPICLDNFDLLTKAPIMVCYNQHSICAICLPKISQRQCPICKDNMIPRKGRKKNRLVLNAIQQYQKAKEQALKQPPKLAQKSEIKDSTGQKASLSGHIFRGTFQDGELTGPCEITTSQGHKFIGIADGDNYIGRFESTADGTVVDGIFSLVGEHFIGMNCVKKYSNGNTFEGNVKDMKADGPGIMKFENGNIFEGQFEDNFVKPNSEGRFTGGFTVQANQDGEISFPSLKEIIQGSSAPKQRNSHNPLQQRKTMVRPRPILNLGSGSGSGSGSGKDEEEEENSGSESSSESSLDQDSVSESSLGLEETPGDRINERQGRRFDREDNSSRSRSRNKRGRNYQRPARLGEFRGRPKQIRGLFKNVRRTL